MSDQATCPICHKNLEKGDDIVMIRQKGADGINAASARQNDTIIFSPGCEVHSRSA